MQNTELQWIDEMHEVTGQPSAGSLTAGKDED